MRQALGLEACAMVDVFHRLRSVDDVPFALETTFLPADLTGASSTNRTTGRYRRYSGTATASTWPARPRYWNLSSSTMRPARRSACAQDRRALCSPAALRTPRGDVWITPATSTALIARRSRFPNSSGPTDSRRSECALALP